MQFVIVGLSESMLSEMLERTGISSKSGIAEFHWNTHWFQQIKLETTLLLTDDCTTLIL